MFSVKRHIGNIEKNGYTIIRNGIDKDLATKVIAEFDEWSSNEIQYNQQQISNFHMYSNNTKDVVTNNYVNKILTSLFKNDPVVYSSLFFKKIINQTSYQRDTPHFYTNPIDQFYGVWYALEDMHSSAGPIKYYIGSHKLDVVDGHEIYNSIYTDEDEVNLNNDFRCFTNYVNPTLQQCKDLNLSESTRKDNLYKGDIVILHPRLMHGESAVIDNTLTRYSMFTCYIPINTAVFESSHYFSKSPTENYVKNECVFKYVDHNDVKLVDHGVGPHIQTTFT